MKVVLINTSDSKGGASIACRRLLFALDKLRCQVKMLVRDKSTTHDLIISTGTFFLKKKMNSFHMLLERIYFISKANSKKYWFIFSPANTGENIAKNVHIKESDIIHLHWINQGFLSLKGLEKLVDLKKPIVWTLHDMWAFTGGCHHSADCESYKIMCANCPMLKNPATKDLSNSLWNKKSFIYKSANLNVVTCSKWLALCAQQSGLFKNIQVHSIPNPIDTNAFSPINKSELRSKYNLTNSKRYILFGAENLKNTFKGFSFFVDALNELILRDPKIKNETEVIVFGKSTPELIQLIPLNVINFSIVSSENKMIELYNMSDVYVTSSIQENLPNTIMESMSCGCPVVGFRIGGIPEMIDHQINGYVADYKSVSDLATGINWVLYKSEIEELKKQARNKVLNHYSEEVVAGKYLDLYQKLINK